MTSEAIQKMKETQSLVLTRGQYYSHFLILIVFLVPPAIHLINLFKYYVTNTNAGVNTIGDMTAWSYLPLIPGVILFYIQKKRLKFKILPVAITSDVFAKVVKATSERLSWDVIEKRRGFVIAKSGLTWRSWGEQITIIVEKERILFNSICDPDSFASIASWGMNRRNFAVFKEELTKECA